MAPVLNISCHHVLLLYTGRGTLIPLAKLFTNLRGAIAIVENGGSQISNDS